MNNLSAESRVWIFQTDKVFEAHDREEIQQLMARFVAEWTAHNHSLNAASGVYHDRFLVFMVDEQLIGASGCSLDKLTHFVQSLDQKFGMDSFNRMQFAWVDKDQIKLADAQAFREMYASGIINNDTKVFDHLVSNKSAFEQSWIKPLSESWHRRFV